MSLFKMDRAVIAILSIAAGFTTILCGISMAQPWGDNYAYQDIWGYFVLAGFLAWACSPYIYLFMASMQAQLPAMLKALRLILAVLVCLGGVAIVIDTAFIHLDAQGGLVFIFLPLYQWMAIAVFLVIEVLEKLVGRANAT